MKLNEYEHAISQPSLIWNPNKGKPQMGGSCSAKWGPYGSKSGSTTDPFLLLFVVLNRPGKGSTIFVRPISPSPYTHIIYTVIYIYMYSYSLVMVIRKQQTCGYLLWFYFPLSLKRVAYRVTTSLFWRQFHPWGVVASWRWQRDKPEHQGELS